MNRIIYYYQTFVGLQDILDKKVVTHIHLSSIHFGHNKDGSPYIHLNDAPPGDSTFVSVWKECNEATDKGITIVLMVGGAGGAFTDLFEHFDIFYPMLQQLIQTQPSIKGIDLDIEECVSLDDVKMLIRQLKEDFGEDFIIAMAPLGGSLMSDGSGMGGFVYKTLYESKEGQMIEYFNGQFYGSFSFDAYHTAIQNGYPPEKVVMGMESGQFDKDTFYKALHEVTKIKQKYPTFGGVFNWEYCNSPPTPSSPSEWASEMYNSIHPKPPTYICSLQ
jgi:hypothetical protein